MATIPVILSGGSGTRLWPVSREAHPKPFIRLPDGESLLAKAYRRAACLPDAGPVLTLTNREYFFKSRDEYEIARTKAAGAGGREPLFLLEPAARNTAPAIALAAHRVAAEFGPQATLLVLPADHLIEDETAFAAAVAAARRIAAAGYLVTFGIQPTRPETGFGYIERGAALAGGGHAVARFVEKPSREKAAEYLADGRHLWNAGMFCFAAATFLAELAAADPPLAAAAEQCWRATAGDGAPRPLLDIDAPSFEALPDISVDYALFEKSRRVAVLPCGFAWNDIGSWAAFAELVPADAAGNRVNCGNGGEAVLIDAADCYIDSEDKLVAALGVRNLVVVDTPDALLVADRERAQDVRKIVDRLKAGGHPAYRQHLTATRPWGTFTVLEQADRYKIKRIVVKPGAALSLQMHHHRSEHWVVVSGTARVTNGERVFLVNSNESTFIPAGHPHRLENPGLIELVMIEVQSGDYVGEDDIVRLADDYGRVPDEPSA